MGVVCFFVREDFLFIMFDDLGVCVYFLNVGIIKNLVVLFKLFSILNFVLDMCLFEEVWFWLRRRLVYCFGIFICLFILCG